MGAFKGLHHPADGQGFLRDVVLDIFRLHLQTEDRFHRDPQNETISFIWTSIKRVKINGKLNEAEAMIDGELERFGQGLSQSWHLLNVSASLGIFPVERL